MNKVVLASLLAVGSLSLARNGAAQQPVNLGGQNAGGQVQMSAEEYKVYNDANTATTDAAKASGLEGYLKAYPQSSIKADVLQTLLFTYSKMGDIPKTLDAADRLLQVDPNNLRALTFETYLRRSAADALTDPAAKVTALDTAADFAQKGIAATKPKDMSDADFKTLQSAALPTFKSAIADDNLAKKDNAGAIAALKDELNSVPLDQTKAVGPVLQDVYVLAQAYYTSTPPDYVNCTFYATRAAIYAPEPFKTQIQQLASYCYKKYHGKAEGYDAVVAAARDNLNPPAGFTIAPAPSATDMVAKLIAETPDLASLAISDKEYVIQYGRPAVVAQPAADGKPAVDARPADADRVFDTVKGKSVEFPDTLVIEATADQVKVAVSEDAIQSKTADFAFNFKEPLKTVPAVGTRVTLSGTYASYTQTPLLIIMNDAAVVAKKTAKPPAKKSTSPARRPAHK